MHGGRLESAEGPSSCQRARSASRTPSARTAQCGQFEFSDTKHARRQLRGMLRLLQACNHAQGFVLHVRFIDMVLLHHHVYAAMVAVGVLILYDYGSS
jgi:hypothetical protein